MAALLIKTSDRPIIGSEYGEGYFIKGCEEMSGKEI